MNSTMMVSNLVILSTTMNGDGPGGLFPHAWALLIWFAVTCLTFMVIIWPWTSWTALIDQYPITEGQRQRNAVYRRKIRILLACAFLVSVLGVVIPLMCGL